MKLAWCGSVLTAMLLAASPALSQQQANLMVDGSFESGIQCSATKRDYSAPSPNIVEAPEHRVHETVDTWNGSRGALRLRIQRQPGFDYWSHVAGVDCPWVTTLPAGTRVRIELSAKSVASPTWINVSRFWGGGNTNIYVTSEWKRYVSYFTVDYDTGGVLFSIVAQPVRQNIQPLIDGEVLIDDVFVRIAVPGEEGDAAPAQLPADVARDIGGYRPGDVGCGPALQLLGSGTNSAGEPAYASLSYWPPESPGCHVPPVFCDANDEPLATPPAEAFVPSDPGRHCTALGKIEGAACGIDPSTVTTPCSSSADCEPGYACGSVCTSASCTEVGLRCGKHYASCAGLEAEASCEDASLYECPDRERDIGAVQPAAVDQQLPEQLAPEPTVSLPPSEQVALPPVLPPVGDYCDVDELKGAEKSLSQGKGNTRLADQGNDKWGAYIAPSSSTWLNFKPMKFLGSGEFEVGGAYGLKAGVKLFGKQIDVVGADASAGIAHCGVAIGASFKVFGDAVWIWDAASVPAGVNVLAGKTPEDQKNECLRKFTEQHDAAQRLRKTLFAAHNLVDVYKKHGISKRICEEAKLQLSMSHLDCTPGLGGIIEDTTSREIVQHILRDYDLSAENAQRVEAELDVIKGKLKVDAELELFKIRPKPYTVQLVTASVPIGPVTLTLAADGYGQYGLLGSVAVGLSYDGNLAQGQLAFGAGSTRDVRAMAGPKVTPEFGIGAAAFAGVGIPGVAVGIEGRVNLFTLQLPVEARFGIARVRVPDGRDFSLHYPGPSKPGLENVAYRWQAAGTFGSKAKLSLLDGRINLAVRVNFLIVKKTFRKKLVDWRGISKEYKLFSTAAGAPLSVLSDVGSSGDDMAYPELAMPPVSVPEAPDPNLLLPTPLSPTGCDDIFLGLHR